MILANRLTLPGGPPILTNPGDPLRIPLGVLSGMGFIGAGAIIRRENLIIGVTTAATVWFVTIMGLCFGSGQLGLGGVAAAVGLGVLGRFDLGGGSAASRPARRSGSDGFVPRPGRVRNPVPHRRRWISIRPARGGV